MGCQLDQRVAPRKRWPARQELPEQTTERVSIRWGIGTATGIDELGGHSVVFFRGPAGMNREMGRQGCADPRIDQHRLPRSYEARVRAPYVAMHQSPLPESGEPFPQLPADFEDHCGG